MLIPGSNTCGKDGTGCVGGVGMLRPSMAERNTQPARTEMQNCAEKQ